MHTKSLPFYQVWVSPFAFFQQLKDKTGTSWQAFLLVSVATALMMFSVYQAVTPENAAAFQMAMMSQDMSPSELQITRESLIEAHGSMSWFMLAFMPLLSVVTSFIMAVYLSLVGKLTGNVMPFKRWFGLGFWLYMPMVLQGIMICALVWLGDLSQQSIWDLQYFASLNHLFFQLPESHQWFGLTTSVSLISIWSLVLTGLALKAWTKLGPVATWLVALIPAVVPVLLAVAFI